MTTKQKIFIDSYIAGGFNATKAAKQAGYSEKTAYSSGQRLLKDVEIKVEIEKRIEQHLTEIGVNKKAVLEQISNLAFADIRQIFNEVGSFKNMQDIDERTAAAISGVKFTTKKNEDGDYEEVTDIKFADKKGVLEILCKHLGLVVEKHQFEGDSNINLNVRLINVEPVVHNPDTGKSDGDKR